MAYRKFDTGTWNDPWFESLSPKAKLAFIYFWTNEICNQAGIYEISTKRINFDLGYHIDTIYSEISDKIYWNKDKNYVWVKNFFKRQCQNQKFAISALNSIRTDSEKLQLFISYNKDLLESYKIDLTTYHIDTISISYPTEQNRTDTDTDTPLIPPRGDGVRPKKTKLTKTQQKLFDKFYSAYPKKKSKGQAEKAWLSINPDEQLLAVMIATIERAKTSEDWQKEGGRFVPYPATWLRAKGWEDEMCSDQPNHYVEPERPSQPSLEYQLS